MRASDEMTITSSHRARHLIVIALIVVYAFVPADRAGILSGPPWRDLGGVILAVGLLVSVLGWTSSLRPHNQRFVMVLLATIVIRMALSSAYVPHGWSSHFVLHHGDGSIVAQRVGPRASDGGVVDPVLVLSDQPATLQFLNDGSADPGGPDAAKIASFEARWRGHVFLAAETHATFSVASDAPVELSIDNSPSSWRESVGLAPGLHSIEVLFRKPGGMSPRLTVAIADAAGPLQVYANPLNAGDVRRDHLARLVQQALDVFVLLVAATWLRPFVGERFSHLRRYPLSRLLYSRVTVVALPMMLFTLQGLAAAHTRSGLTVFLVGDDLRFYASAGRDIILRGLLGNAGQPLFQGEPFFFYPLYPYFVALSHVLFDESLYGLVLLQFLLLGATFAATALMAFEMFGVVTGWVTLVLLCALGELDFVRYYTVSVFTDNLYYPLVAFAAYELWRLETNEDSRSAIAAGVLGGLATITRPSMLFVLPLLLAWSSRRFRSGLPFIGSRMLVVAASWVAVIAVVTFRNWLVSGRVVLIAESSLQVLFFLAPPGVNWADYLEVRTPSIAQTVRGAFRMFADYPLGVAQVELRKLAFMIGFTNVMPGFRLHPEFLALTATYIGWWLLKGRPAFGATAHLSLLGHALAFLVASPMSYGYKTMLTLMMLMTPFSADFLVRSCERIFGRRLQLSQAE
jgi:hypothetical protein